MARPKLEIDERKVRTMASFGCTYEEIASVLGCSVKTLKRRYKEAFNRGQDAMRASVRRMQVEKAEAGNVTMLIWLGKQYLGQTDRTDTTVREMTVEVNRLPPPRKED